jgi:archaellum biogenesis ATPase FlaH
MEKALLALLLKNQFFLKVKPNLSKDLFPDKLAKIFEAIVAGHEKYNRDLKLSEVIPLVSMKYPATTTAEMDMLKNLVDEIGDQDTLGEDLGEQLIFALWKKEEARKIAETALGIVNGETTDLSTLSSRVQRLVEGTYLEPRYSPVTDDISELVGAFSHQNAIRFNITDLQERVGGIGPGNLFIAFARPETGKTAFWVSLACAPNGWLHQGYKVHAFVNEEPAIRTKMRCISAMTGRTSLEIQLDPLIVQEEWNAFKDNLKVYDSVDMSLDMLNEYCRTNSPDILVVDQLDKVHVGGTYAREDQKLKQIYVGAREIAKRYGCMVLGLSQASAEAHGRGNISFDMMENSRTGKAAEADLIVGIGFNENLEGGDSPHRTLCVSKNKLSGWHGIVHANLQGALSRYVD